MVILPLAHGWISDTFWHIPAMVSVSVTPPQDLQHRGCPGEFGPVRSSTFGLKGQAEMGSHALYVWKQEVSAAIKHGKNTS